jgi:membrane fusion protein (multidrug efflux system)
MPEAQELSPQSATPTDAALPDRRVRRRRVALAAGVLALAVLAYAGYWFFWSRTRETTDDAQVEGHVHAVASQVPGYVAELCVDDNQLVAPGDILLRIRPDDYQARLALAEANLAQAQAALLAAEHTVDAQRGSTEAQIAQARAGVQQAEAQFSAAQQDAESAKAKLAAAEAALQQAGSQARAAQADYDYASFNQKRVADLRAQNAAAADESQLADSNAQAAEARLAAAKDLVSLNEAQVTVAQRGVSAAQAAVVVAQAAIEQQKAKLADALTGPDQVRVAEARAALAQAQIQAAQADLDTARLNLGYCTVTAPAAGVVTKRSVEVGQYLQPGQPILAIVPLEDTWVVANFKETQLRNMRVGQPVTLLVDAYPDHPFRGVVDSLAAGTGARFSLLPPENATGNFVKVVQRVPVKLVLRDGQRDAQRPLRPGMNVVVTVDTRKQSAAEDWKLAVEKPHPVSKAQSPIADIDPQSSVPNPQSK